MKRFVVAALLTGVMSSPALAEPGGCLKYGAAGAVAGHFVGEGNTVAGALAGCAAGMFTRGRHRANEAKAERERAAFNAQRERDRLDHERAMQQRPSYPQGGYQSSAPRPTLRPGESCFTNPAACAR